METTDSTPAPAPLSDAELAQKVVDELGAKGLDCTVDDVMFGRGLSSFIDSYIERDRTAANRATKQLANPGSPHGMAAAVLLGKLKRQLAEATTEEEKLGLVGVCMLHVLNVLDMQTQRPKWGKR